MIEITRFFGTRIEDSENIERRVQNAFEIIRECPYDSTVAFPTSGSLEETVSDFMKMHKGSCSPKHYTLGLYYESLGLSVRYLTYPFYWQEQTFKFPSSLSAFIEKVPIQYHTALLISKQGVINPKIVDATWDAALESTGVPINIDISTDNKLGVIPYLEPFIHTTAQAKWEFQKTSRDLTPPNKNIQPFYSALNSWLSDVRSSASL